MVNFSKAQTVLLQLCFTVEVVPNTSVRSYGHVCKCVRLFRVSFGLFKIAFHSVL